MSDLGHLSDEEVMAAAGLGAPKSAPSLAHLSDEDILRAAGVQAAPKAPESNAGAAALEGFGQGAAAGYLPQLQALVGKLAPNPNADLDAKLKSQGFNIKQGNDSYTQLRDENIARQERLRASNPWVYNGAQLAGGISTAPLATKAISAIAPGISAAKAAILTSGALGGLQNPGDTAGAVDPIQGLARLKNAGVGTLLGWGGNKLASALGSAPEDLINSGKALNSGAEEIAIGAAGGQKPQMKLLNKADKVGDVGRFIIDNDIAPAGATPKEMAEKTSGLLSDAWGKLKGVYDAIDSSGGAGKFNREEIASALRDSLGGVDSLRPVPGAPNSTVRNSINELISEFENAHGPASLDEIRNLKTMYGKNAGYNKMASPPLADGFKSMERTLADAISNRADALSNQVRGPLGDQLRAANRQYHLASLADDLVDNKLAQQGNNFMTLGDKFMAGIGSGLGMLHGGIGTIPGAIAGLAVSKAAKRYGPGAAVAAADAIGNRMQGMGNAISGPLLPAISQAAQYAMPAATAQFQRDKINPWTNVRSGNQ